MRITNYLDFHHFLSATLGEGEASAYQTEVGASAADSLVDDYANKIFHGECQRQINNGTARLRERKRRVAINWEIAMHLTSCSHRP